MRRVFVLNDGGHDYSAAEKFGKITFCSSNLINRWDIAQMYREMKEALYEANFDDYIMISSLTSLCCVATAIMADRFGVVNFLVWKDSQYIERSLVLDNTE